MPGSPAPKHPRLHAPASSTLGSQMLLVFALATGAMVAAVVLVAAIGAWWVLLPVMLTDLVVTGLVTAVVIGLLGDEDGA